jgi:hypothetical protein
VDLVVVVVDVVALIRGLIRGPFVRGLRFPHRLRDNPRLGFHEIAEGLPAFAVQDWEPLASSQPPEAAW